MTAPLILANPHAVAMALEHRPAGVVELRLPPGGAGPAWREAAGRAAALGVPVLDLEPEGDRPPRERPAGADGGRRDGRRSGRAGARRRSGDRGAERRRPQTPGGDRRGSGAHARVLPRPPAPLDALFRDPLPGDRWLALDQVQDPHNVGSILRSAAFFGVRGLILTADRAAPMSAVVYDTASGGVELVPHAVEPNLRRALDAAREAGIWVLGADERGTGVARRVDRDRPWLLALGNEERGLRRLTREACDDIVRLESGGPLQTLNVAVATAVLLSVLEVAPD